MQVRTHYAGILDDTLTPQGPTRFAGSRHALLQPRGRPELPEGFCNLSDAEFSAGLIRDGAAVDWWERGALRRR